MLIALPNLDGSFTCTFFFPLKGEPSFESIATEEKAYWFFTQQFPDAVALMPEFLGDYFSNPTGSMVTVKCTPWHVAGKALLLGDAAHAIVPFFGQGMNCAFEDCTYLDECIAVQQEKSDSMDWEMVFGKFHEQRKANADAIADMALENFIEMRDLVADPKFQMKKNLEHILEGKYPGRFIPKYSMVTFHRIPYSVALLRGKIQDRLLTELCEKVHRIEDIDWKKADALVNNELPADLKLKRPA